MYIYVHPLSEDTSPEAAAIQFAGWRAMSPREKLRQVTELTQTVLMLERAGLRVLHPELKESETFRFLADRRLGAPLAERAFGARRVGG